jgi:hypothetical protein
MALGAVWTISACKSTAAGPSGDPSVGIAVEAACTDLAGTVCDKLEACAPATVRLIYGDAPTCAERQKLDCTTLAAAPHVTAPSADATSCASLVHEASCDGLFSALGHCVVTPGTLDEGAACGAESQCSTAHCKRDPSTGCGVCAQSIAAGDSCADDPGGCAPGLICDSQKHCGAKTAKGGPCDHGQICEAPFVCVDGTCGDGAAPGSACGADAGACDPLAARCDPGSSTCAELGFALAGQACGLVGGKAVFCAGLGTCDIAESATKGTCYAAARDGEACGGDKHIACIPPAECVGGKCEVRAVSRCQ